MAFSCPRLFLPLLRLLPSRVAGVVVFMAYVWLESISMREHVYGCAVARDTLGILYIFVRKNAGGCAPLSVRSREFRIKSTVRKLSDPRKMHTLDAFGKLEGIWQILGER